MITMYMLVATMLINGPAEARDMPTWTTCERTGKASTAEWSAPLAEWMCGNDEGAPVYRTYWSGKLRKVGELVGKKSAFLCWTRGAWTWGSGDIWYYTQASRITTGDAEGGWGYVPSLYVHNDPDPVEGMAKCPDGSSG